MSYRLKQGEKVEKGIQRIAREQIEKAIGEVEDPELDRHETVHQVRKRCKKVRAVVRLVRPEFDGYRFENQWFRDAARELSYVRDAEALLETYDELMEKFEDQVDRSAFAPIRRGLTLRKKEIASDEMDLDRRLKEFLASMREAYDRVETWELDAKGFEAVAGGLKKTYKRGHKAMDEAYEDPSSENFHEWRKRVKYHWYHMRILRDIWKPVMKKRRDEVDDLADWLGDDHDLAVFREVLRDETKRFGSKRNVQAFTGLIDRRRAQLQAKCWPVGRRVFAEKPGDFVQRMEDYWKAWKSPEEQDSTKLMDPVVPVSA